MSVFQRHTRLLVVGLLLAAASALSHAEIINFDDKPAGPIPYPYHQLTFAQSPYDGIRDALDPEVANGIVSAPNAFLLSNQGTSIQALSTNGDYPKTFTFRGAYFTAATNDGLVVTVTGMRWSRNVRTKTFVLSTASPTYVSFNWAGLDEIQISASGGVPVKDKNSTMIIMDDLNTDMDGPFAFTPD